MILVKLLKEAIMKPLELTKNYLKKFPGIIEKFMGGKLNGPRKSDDDIDVVPSVNITDSHTDEFEISVAVPGLTKNDIDIHVEENCLKISSEKSYNHHREGKNWRIREFNYGSFQRIFELPENADTEKIKASMKDGILTIHIGKKKGVKQNFRKIRVI
jgi:HSP20 family protein